VPGIVPTQRIFVQAFHVVDEFVQNDAKPWRKTTLEGVSNETFVIQFQTRSMNDLE
jgi:hypothetical protein